MTAKDQVKNQGEGNREAARNYNERAEKFAKDQPVEDIAEDAAPASERERKEMADAEKKGKSKARSFDPEVTRNYKK